jgi:hypothetical protein
MTPAARHATLATGLVALSIAVAVAGRFVLSPPTGPNQIQRSASMLDSPEPTAIPVSDSETSTAQPVVSSSEFLGANASRNYQFESGGSLDLSLASGDLTVDVQDSGGRTSLQSSFSGYGQSQLTLPALQPGSTYAVKLSSRQGAAFSLTFQPGNVGHQTNVVTHANVSSAISATSVSASSVHSVSSFTSSVHSTGS